MKSQEIELIFDGTRKSSGILFEVNLINRRTGNSSHSYSMGRESNV